MAYGAAGDGKTPDTKAIQKTIDKANKIGNRTRVLIPASHKFLIGTNCSISWRDNIPDYFTNAIYAHDATDVKIVGFKGPAAHPDRDKAIVIPESDTK